MTNERSPGRLAGALQAIQAGPCNSPLLGMGMVLWALIMVALWPQGLSFSDEVGYVGEARLLLGGHLTPSLADPGVWVQTAHGLVSQYPLLLSAILIPFLAVGPSAIFVVGLLSGLALCYAGARVLEDWGTDSVWALLLLMHPTVVILSRTVTSDVVLAALGIVAWLALRDNRRALAVASFAALFAIKATGMLVGGCLVAGQLLPLLSRDRLSRAAAKERLATCGLAAIVGFLAIVVSNEISAHQPWFAYDLGYLGTPPFWFSYFTRSAPAHLRTVLLFPPLLIVGALPYWRRSAWGPLLVIFGYGALMCFYFFVDSGRTVVESLVLSPRLLMPAFAFLLVGYADVCAAAVRRFLHANLRMGSFLVLGTAAVAAVVGIRHRRWQAPMALARSAAEETARRLGATEIGFAPQAAKAALLLSGPIRVAPASENRAAVVLCSDHSASYRAPNDGGDYSCAIPGYHVEHEVGGFQILVQNPTSPGASR